MRNLSRRDFLATASAAALATASSLLAGSKRDRVFVATGTQNGILAYDWDSERGELSNGGVAAQISTVDWLTWSPDKKYLYAACEVDTFNGKPTGEVGSFIVQSGELRQLSAQNSAGKGTCHVAIDRTGRVLLSADYGGGSAASFQVA